MRENHRLAFNKPRRYLESTMAKGIRPSSRTDPSDELGTAIEQFERELDSWFDSVGHPVREQVVKLLLARSPRTRAELRTEIETSPSTLARSLRRMVDKRILIVTEDRRGYELRRSLATTAQERSGIPS
jgi:DNA-binding HxlR family transcriptional regulator